MRLRRSPQSGDSLVPTFARQRRRQAGPGGLNSGPVLNGPTSGFLMPALTGLPPPLCQQEWRTKSQNATKAKHLCVQRSPVWAGCSGHQEPPAGAVQAQAGVQTAAACPHPAAPPQNKATKEQAGPITCKH